MNPILHTQALKKQYQLGDVALEVLRGIDLAVAAGEFVAIMGPSGSGKSTLLHLLGGLDRPTAGDICLEGGCYAALSDDELTLLRRRQIGFVFQFFNLMPTLTAQENVLLPLMMDGRRSAESEVRAASLLAQVGLAERQQHRPHQLSGGQQQRVAIARALMTQPRLILADEPTGNLDSAASADVLALLRRARDEHQQTVIMVTHDSHAASIADRIIFLKDGQITHELGRDAQKARTTQEIVGIMNALS